LENSENNHEKSSDCLLSPFTREKDKEIQTNSIQESTTSGKIFREKYQVP
jgi:hypothetical protein